MISNIVLHCMFDYLYSISVQKVENESFPSNTFLYTLFNFMYWFCRIIIILSVQCFEHFVRFLVSNSHLVICTYIWTGFVQFLVQIGGVSRIHFRKTWTQRTKVFLGGCSNNCKSEFRNLPSQTDSDQTVRRASEKKWAYLHHYSTEIQLVCCVFYFFGLCQ